MTDPEQRREAQNESDDGERARQAIEEIKNG